NNRWLETDIADVTNPLYSLAKTSRLLKFIITQHDRESKVDQIPCLVENMILILYHTPKDSPTTPPKKCTQDIYHLYKDWPGLDEINKDDPILSYDPFEPMQVQAVYKDMKDVVDNLVQSIHGNNEETKHLETKLVYYLERCDKILNPDDHKTIIKKKCVWRW
ncbi:11350_t:CDS:2, partial [Dentiscutata erythropus]